MDSRKFEVGQRVRVKEGYVLTELHGVTFADPTGLEGVVVDYDDEYEYPVYVVLEPEPDGATDAVHYHYDELFTEDELEAVE